MAEQRQMKKFVVMYDQYGRAIPIEAQYVEAAKQNGYREIGGGSTSFDTLAEAEEFASRLRNEDVGQQQRQQEQAVGDAVRPRRDLENRRALAQEAGMSGPATSRQPGAMDARRIDDAVASGNTGAGIVRGRGNSMETDFTQQVGAGLAAGNNRTVAGGGGAYDPLNPTANPVDPAIAWGSDDWASRLPDQQYVANLVMSGGMTPDLAVEYMLDSMGVDNFANSGVLEDVYSAFPTFYKLNNFGNPVAEMTDLYSQGSEYAQKFTGSYGDNQAYIPDARGMWDNMFSPAAIGQGRTDQSMTGDAYQSERDLVMEAIKAFGINMNPDGQRYLAGMVDQAWKEFHTGGYGAQGMSFLEYLEAIGAEDWM